MLNFGRRSLASLAITGCLLAAATLPAQADGVSCPAGQRFDRRSGSCTVTASEGGSEPSRRPDRIVTPVTDRGHQNSVQPLCRAHNSSTRELESVPCRTSQGYWSNQRECYLRPMRPAPAKTSALWAGHDDGAVYECVRTMGQVTVAIRFWSKSAPTAPAAPPDPAVVARTVTRQMQLRAITIGMAPENEANRVGIVGMPAWMWVADQDLHTFGPQTRSASVGGTSVSAVARVDRIVWSMGDGRTVMCRTAGTPFADGDGGLTSPDCGYTYRQQGEYTVHATSYWTVVWTSNTGASGSIPLEFDASRRLTVGEIQVVRS